jgi:hypothetical protein
MIKPYSATHEGRYIGLPLGFGFLGASYAISAIAFFHPYSQGISNAVTWTQLLFRGFSFVFLAVTYYFSKKPSKNTHYFWNITFSVLFVLLGAFLLLFFIAPQIPLGNYLMLNIFIRSLNVVCLSYIFIHCFKEYVKKPNPESIFVISSYALLGLSQFLYIILTVGFGYTVSLAFWVSLALRLTSLFVFLFATYRTFYQLKNGSRK